ncbi:cadherin domain-containing protein [Flavobacterium tiangeerense]|uniref:cadherin domain-containing protein n=1 Tax=Flavobacterium tiangeerense TaxID=459471 RepID=UPI0011A6B410|nr:cadherin domain-containing protein [Flavobacterium tiangeerense]
MKNFIYSTIVLFLVSFSTFGQSPSWTLNENNFQYTMTFVGSLNIDGVRLANVNDKVAAFVNGECRGVTNLIYVATENKYYAYLTVFSNTNNETISFKMYDSEKNVVKDVFKTASFTSNANFGNLSQTYIFSNNALRQGADLLDVGFVGVTRNDITIVGNKVTVFLNPGQTVTALNTTFTSSPGSTVYIGNVQQTSGSNSLDFSNPVVFKVYSEDLNVVKEWTVAVQMPTYPVTLPTVFTLSKLTINENQAVGTVVGDFNVLIEDRVVSDLSLVAGDGGFDNSSFEIIGNKLLVKNIFDFETKSIYKIRVQGISNRKEIVEKIFEITVLDDKLPTVFTLSKSTIDENQAVGTVVGDFTVAKEDRTAFTLSLVDGAGGEDNSSFEIIGNSLKVKSIFDFEAKSSYKIRVQAVSSRGDVLDQNFTITVLDDKLPTVFTLSKSTIDENQAVGTVVGDFTVVKEDRTAFTLSLVDGVGGEDNSSFEITGNSLKVKSIFDFETKNIYKIRVQAVSSRGDVLEQNFTITILDDKLPTVFTLSKSTIDENKPGGTVVGDFTVAKEDRTAFTLSLVDGVGGEDNSSFEIAGNSLKVKSIFDFETKNIYKVRVQAVSSRGDVLEQNFTITVLDDKLPTVFTLSKLTIDENQPVATVVGDFTVVREDRTAFVLSFIEGVGADDNASFEIIGNSLKVKSIFDFESKSTYKIRVQAASSRGDVLEQSFTITVLDDKLPTIFSLSKVNIDENQVVASVVGDFTVIKENRTVFALSLVDGVGGEDNASFEITGNSLKSKEMFDFETKNSYKIRIKAQNTLGEVLFANYVITINDINDTPVLITISNDKINENLPAGTVIGTLKTKDQDKDSSIYRFSISGSDYLNFDLVGEQLVLKKSLDFEKQNVFQFELISNDQRGGEVKEKMTIYALDVNENPVITKNVGSNAVNFVLAGLSNNAIEVGKVQATDVDANSALSWEISPGQQVPFTITKDGIISFDGTIDPNNKTSYSFTVKVTDNGTPKLSDTITVNVTIEFTVNDTLMYNNLVSPNGDGLNDRLLINNIQLYSNYVLAIYNSKGQMVLSTSNYKNDWTGNGLAEGEYYLYFTGKDPSNKERVYKELVRLVYN